MLQRSFDLAESKQLISSEQVTQLYGVPTMFQLFHQSCHVEELSSVRYCFSAAAPLPLQVSRRWLEKFGMPIHEGYGLTETSPFASYNHRLRYLAGSIGTPIDNVEMRIVDHETGEECSAGELGEIVIRGPNVMLGYWNRPKETAEVLRDGWFHSGDIGQVDENGYFSIVDRLKDMISVGGLKVYPAEVERVLLDHHQVSEVAVVGLHDDVFGEQVVAFVVPTAQKADDTQDLANTIKEYAQSHLANYKAPRRVVLMEKLPRNPSGKVLKKELRERTVAPEQADSDSAGIGASEYLPQPQLRPLLVQTHRANHRRAATQFVQQLVQSFANSPDLPNPETGLLDLGLDSLMIVEVSNYLQAELGKENPLPATLVFDYPRICDLADFLVTALTEDKQDISMASSNSPQKIISDSPVQLGQLREQIESMSEEQAYAELIRELDNA